MRLPRLKARWQWAVAGIGGLAVAGALFVWVAPYNIAASQSHLPGVRWLLHTYMVSAVKTWSMGEKPPAWLDTADPALVRLGAGHYENGCAPCHGAPGRAGNPIVHGMLPEPPELRPVVGRYALHELYWLVRNGLKYTSMPHWSGEHRDDEPWAVAAFLAGYDEIDAETYAELAWGPSEPDHPLDAPRAVALGGSADRLDRLVKGCARCHGPDGLGRDGTAPKLAGQSEPYLRETLHAYASNRRQSGFMEPLAAPLAPAEIDELARHYASMPPFGADPLDPAEAARYALGAELAARGNVDVPSCLSCHGEGLTPPRKPLYPRISGQSRRFLVAWLHLWRERSIGGTNHAHLMHAAAERLEDEEIEALAVYFSAGGGGAELARRD